MPLRHLWQAPVDVLASAQKGSCDVFKQSPFFNEYPLSHYMHCFVFSSKFKQESLTDIHIYSDDL